MLVSVDRYRTLTRDVSTETLAVSENLDSAQRLLERHLDRPLDFAAGVTETLTPYRDEWGALCVQPRRAPVQATEQGTVRGEVEIVAVGSPIFMSLTAWQDGLPFPPTTITFDGGWHPYGETDHVIPVELERAIAFIARGLLRETDIAAVTGTTNVTHAVVGDVQVQFSEPGEGLDRYGRGIADAVQPYAYRPYV